MASCNSDPISQIRITTDTLEDGRVMMPYGVALEVTDTTGEIFWGLTDGELPPGLIINEYGFVQGVPERSGNYSFEVTVWDDLGESTAGLQIGILPVVLMSGFEPFGFFPTNSSWESLVELQEKLVAGLDVRAVKLPVLWGVSWHVLQKEIDRLHPDVVIATGQASSDAMRFETVASNKMIGWDAGGQIQIGAPIVKDGPDTLSTTLPLEEMAAAMAVEGFATKISENAGSWLCNCIMYQLLYLQRTSDDVPKAAGFVHVPPAPFDRTFGVEDITTAHLLGLHALANWLDASEEIRTPLVDTHTAPVYSP